MPRHQLNISEETYQSLDKYRHRIGEMEESWDKFFRRIMREGKLERP